MKQSKKRVKRAITLIEIMVVITIIGFITGALAFNYKKSLDKGKQMKTAEIVRKVEAAINMAIVNGEYTVAEVVGTSTSHTDKLKELLGKSALIPQDQAENFIK